MVGPGSKPRESCSQIHSVNHYSQRPAEGKGSVAGNNLCRDTEVLGDLEIAGFGGWDGTERGPSKAGRMNKSKMNTGGELSFPRKRECDFVSL